MQLRRLEINGGLIIDDSSTRLIIPPSSSGYTDAQLDDYGTMNAGRRLSKLRRQYRWRGGVDLSLRARFSHGVDQLQGTAGFGFWNAPFGDPTVHVPTLPQATWFFYASSPTDLPLAEDRPGRGWFVATIDASSAKALAVAPALPAVLLLNQVRSLRRRIWPWVRSALGISFAQLEMSLPEWHEYRLLWRKDGCTFSVDGVPVLETGHSPRGPLGFVCWLDNQYLVATNRGRFAWGTLPLAEEQWMEISDLRLTRH